MRVLIFKESREAAAVGFKLRREVGRKVYNILHQEHYLASLKENEALRGGSDLDRQVARALRDVAHDNMTRANHLYPRPYEQPRRRVGVRVVAGKVDTQFFVPFVRVP